MEITGKELCGLTDGELFQEMIGDRCPERINKYFQYKDCGDAGTIECDCLECWRINLSKIYQILDQE